MSTKIVPKIRTPPPDTANPSHNTRIGPKIAIFLLLLIPLSLIGLFPDAQAQTVTANVTGDPFTIGEGNSTLTVYDGFVGFLTSGETINSVFYTSFDDYQVDPITERLILDVGPIRYLLIDLDTTLGELHQTISPDDTSSYVRFQWNFTGLIDETVLIDLDVAIFDDDVTTEQGRIGPGTALVIGDNLSSEGTIRFTTKNDPVLFNTTLADKKIGYIIDFNKPLLPARETPISLDFSLFRIDNDRPINHITRTWDYSIQIPPGLTPEQGTTYENLVNAIAARQAAIDQQTIIVNYWSDSSNPFADDRTLAQARIDHANSHITQSTQQRDSYQAQLDRLTS